MTKEAWEKLPEKAREHLEEYNTIITRQGKEYGEEFKARTRGYLSALKDLGYISEIEKRGLHIYILNERRANK